MASELSPGEAVAAAIYMRLARSYFTWPQQFDEFFRERDALKYEARRRAATEGATTDGE